MKRFLILLMGVVFYDEPALADTKTNIISQLRQNTLDRSSSPSLKQLYIAAPPAMDTIYDVHKLRDVSSDDWAFKALRSLMQRYRCLNGFDDRTFRGDRALSRYEFAVTLSACLTTIEKISDNKTNLLKQDIKIIERLETEFAEDLRIFGERIAASEEKIAFLEDNHFSTRTTLRGTVTFNLTNAFGDRKAVLPGNPKSKPLNTNLALSDRLGLVLDTSFSGRDRLRASFSSGNNSSYGRIFTGTNMTLLSGATFTDQKFNLGTLFYQFPVGNSALIAIAPSADFPTRVFPALNPVDSISNFGSGSPIYSYAFGSGAVAYYNITDSLSAGISYLTVSGPDVKRGLFNGQYSILSQITYNPTEKLGLGFTYGHYYSPTPLTANVTGSKGSQFGQYPFGELTPTSSNNFGLQFTYQFTKQIIVGGWVSYFSAVAEGSPRISKEKGINGANADIWSVAVTASVLDLGKQGSQLSFVFGVPPKVTHNDVSSRQDQDTSLHVELSYRYPINDRINIISGFIVIISPEHNAANPPISVGLLRTNFSF